MGISKSSFSRITQNDIRFHPFRMIIRVKSANQSKQTTFCKNNKSRGKQWNLDLQEVMWSDEAAFHLN